MRMTTLRCDPVEIRAVNVQHLALAVFLRLLREKAGPSRRDVREKEQGLVIVCNFNARELLQTAML